MYASNLPKGVDLTHCVSGSKSGQKGRRQHIMYLLITQHRQLVSGGKRGSKYCVMLYHKDCSIAFQNRYHMIILRVQN